MTDKIEQQLDMHLVRIVHMLEGGITDDEIRVTAGFCGVPEWIILRVGHDLRTLTDEQEARYQATLGRLHDAVREEMNKP